MSCKYAARRSTSEEEEEEEVLINFIYYTFRFKKHLFGFIEEECLLTLVARMKYPARLHQSCY